MCVCVCVSVTVVCTVYVFEDEEVCGPRFAVCVLYTSEPLWVGVCVCVCPSLSHAFTYILTS